MELTLGGARSGKNEAGSGIVPLGARSREFVDVAGFLHQTLAEVTTVVTLVVASLPLALKMEQV